MRTVQTECEIYLGSQDAVGMSVDGEEVVPNTVAPPYRKALLRES
jgi:hypothetical protein